MADETVHRKTAEQLTAWQADVEERQATQYRRIIRVGIAAIVILSVTNALALAGNRSLADAIQEQRAAGYRANCEDQNARNTTTLAKLRAVTDDERARAATQLLIDSLAPTQDCDALVRERVRSR